jgi:hypothetical protein
MDDEANVEEVLAVFKLVSEAEEDDAEDVK